MDQNFLFLKQNKNFLTIQNRTLRFCSVVLGAQDPVLRIQLLKAFWRLFSLLNLTGHVLSLELSSLTYRHTPSLAISFLWVSKRREEKRQRSEIRQFEVLMNKWVASCENIANRTYHIIKVSGVSGLINWMHGLYNRFDIIHEYRWQPVDQEWLKVCKPYEAEGSRFVCNARSCFERCHYCL